jgi:hypothetical protein
MTFDEQEVLGRFHRALVREIHSRNPEHLNAPFSVAEIYQNLVPYRTHRDEIGVEMNADYEHALLRLLAGEGDFLTIESTTARKELRDELDSPNPNTGLYRDFAAADVQLNPEKLDVEYLDQLAQVVPAPTPDDEEPMEVEGMDEDAVVDEFDAEGASGGEYERLEVEPLGANLGRVEEEDAEDLDSEVVPIEVSVEDEDSEVVDADPGEGEMEEEGVDLPPFENCPWCRETLPQQARVRFCPFCGSNIHLVPCPACGEELRLNWRFCIACGTEVES